MYGNYKNCVVNVLSIWRKYLGLLRCNIVQIEGSLSYISVSRSSCLLLSRTSQWSVPRLLLIEAISLQSLKGYFPVQFSFSPHIHDEEPR
jgi:hypothetical protein